MIRKDFDGRNAFFATYYLFDTDAGHYVGILEDHDRGVRERYFVGWRFDGGKYIPGTHQAGCTRSFKNEQDAVNYITWEKA